ncbi:MAG: flagellin [Alphaproteobacteria bacterium]|nr:flagellin [Alphaproteobacteria bacterium]
MTITAVSSLGLQNALTSTLQSEQSTLTQLTAQLSSEQKYQDLTDYTPGDARNLINLQATATQRQAYVSVITTVSNNLSVYDTTLTDLETIASQAQSLANNNPTYSAQTAPNIAAQATSFLNAVTVDLNQDVNGRYIYSGSRYTTAPVQDLAALSTSTLSSSIVSDGQTVPSYDSSSLDLTAGGAAGTVTVSGSVGGYATAQTATITLGASPGTPYTFTLSSADTTTSAAASDLAAQISAIGGGVYTATASGSTITVTDAGGNPVNVGSATTTTTASDAYATDQATIDSGYTVNYGITSNDPSFQKLIAGLRYMQAAGNATDSATYKADMAQASTLLTSAISGLQAVHTNVANNINTMTTEKTSQNTALSNLTDQVDNIQQVDVTQVSAEITSLETILQASYMVTGDILKMSIVSYL